MEQKKILVAKRHARAAQLVYVTGNEPGIRRERRGKSFRYYDSRGRVIKQPKILTRIRALVIPPAWDAVWICASPRGHIQCTGRDGRGRKQYRYHSRWSERRNLTKFDRLVEFAEALPKIRRRVSRHLKLKGMPREKVLATVVRLLEDTHIRVGNDEYARTNHSFGLTTMTNRHVRIRGATVHFAFRGKSGVHHEIDVKSKTLARIVRTCQELPGQHLFEYRVGSRVRRVSSTDVNNYLREVSGQELTAKDFRTWSGSVLANRLIREIRSTSGEVVGKRHLVETVKSVARCLGNTPATCRKFYIHPQVLALLDRGAKRVRNVTARSHSSLTKDELALLAVLKSGEGLKK
ncbi:MAG: DNA topoisomerase IB [Bdellovibrionota bacterium]